MFRTKDLLVVTSLPEEKVPLWTRDYILACCSNLMMGLAFFELVPVLPLYLTGTLRVSSGWLGWIMSIYVVAAIISRPWFAQKVDTGDRKRIYIVVYILLALSFSGYAVATTALFVLLTRFVQGLIWGGMTTSGPTLAVDIIPPSRRGEGLGFFGMTMTLGMCLGPVIGLEFYQKNGFEFITWTSLVLCLCGAGIASLIRAPRAPRQEAVRETPGSVLDRLVLRVGIPLAVNVMMASFSYGVVAVYSALYGKMYGFRYAGLFYALMGAGMLISRFIVGRQIDRGRVAELSVISLSILTFSFASLALFPLEGIYYASAILIGFGFGIFIPTFQTMKLNMADRGHRGAVNSTFFTAFDIGVGAGMFFGGKIFAWLSLNWAFGVGAMLNLLAIVYFYRISLDHYRRNKLGVDSE
ncbi:MFS transporter [Akkermansia sp. N21169]|uniref:MFS transporter n=1 Tax=Akkermansia sp. N21169 TaxID=3040765 RepID=UPI00244E74E4|nr:MFS transporter [Akkermansia sp. N21169]MDH3069004.1 MFS transporter [Akkermansia sp. N21169]